MKTVIGPPNPTDEELEWLERALDSGETMREYCTLDAATQTTGDTMNKVTQHPRAKTEEELAQIERALDDLNTSIDKATKKSKGISAWSKVVQYSILAAIITGCVTFTGWAIVAFVRFAT